MWADQSEEVFRRGGSLKRQKLKQTEGEERTAWCTPGLKYVLDLLTFFYEYQLMGGRWRLRVFCSSNRLYCCTLTLNSWKVFCCAISPDLNLSFYWLLCRSHTEEGFALVRVGSLFSLGSRACDMRVKSEVFVTNVLVKMHHIQKETVQVSVCRAVVQQRCFHLAEILSFHVLKI